MAIICPQKQKNGGCSYNGLKITTGLIHRVWHLWQILMKTSAKQQWSPDPLIHKQTTNDKQQTTNNKWQITNNKRQTTNNKRQTTNDKHQILMLFNTNLGIFTLLLGLLLSKKRVLKQICENFSIIIIFLMQKIEKIQCMGTEKIQFFLLSKPFLAIFSCC